MELATSFVGLLEARADARPDQIAFHFLADGLADGRIETWTYGQLRSRARAVAAELRGRGLAGERALLLYPSGLEFIAAFFGCLYAGVVAVPAYPPDPARLGRTLPRLQRIAQDAGASAILTTDEIAALSRALASFAPDLARLAWISTPALADDGRIPGDLPGDTLAFLQYTSGSTASPKGVRITHANLLHNQRVITEAFGHDETTIALGWLPLFHDMGLIGHVLNPIYLGSRGILMAPQDFLRRPAEWPRAVGRFRATTSGGPDFAYALAARKATGEEIAGMDLSCWRVAYSGAELVRPATMQAFAERFAPAGLDARALLPCYGLAESTLMTTCAPRGRGAVAREGRISVGGPLQGMELRIVDPRSGETAPDGVPGEIWVRGPSVAAGYWGDAAATAETFGARTSDGAGPWLRTGDIGVRADGELAITGRAKDILVIRGRNLHPEDLEQAAEAAHPAVRAGCAAVFPVEVGGEEQVAVACEVEPGADADEVARAIRGAVAAAFDVSPRAVALLARRALPKTSSGKRQRGAARQGFLDGTLEEVARVIFEGAAEDTAAEPPPSSRAEMERWLARLAAGVLGVPAESIDRDATFASLGLDSVRAVELATRLDERLGRPVHASILYTIPTIAQLAAWLVEGGPSEAGADQPPSLYPDLARALARLDARNPDAYRFDIERDVRWDRTSEPGIYVPAEMFATFGLDPAAIQAEPEAWGLLQAASAMTLCTAFEVVEVTISLFIDTRWSSLGPTRSIDLFREEEAKHIRLFRRYADALKAGRPDLAAELGWDPAWGVGFWELFRSPHLFPDERVFHYLFWFFFVAFEEHSIYFADLLAREPGAQPAWRDAHLAHRREEIQHVATDHAYALALDLPDAERSAWSEVCVAWLCQHFETFFAFGPARRLVARRFPALAPSLRTKGFVRSRFLAEILSSPAFRRTRLICPYLRDLQQIDPALWPTDLDLARRLPAAWLSDRVVTLPDPVEGA